MSEHNTYYYLPEPSRWPIITSIALFCLLVGAANWLHGHSFGPYLCLLGFIIFVYMLHGWFSTVIHENRAGLLSETLVDHSFRWGMVWFIFSEVMFFGAFFFALFYLRVITIPWLGGVGDGEMTHLLLWPQFDATWPTLVLPNSELFHGPKSVMETWGIPAINTAILLSSGGTITVAHWAVLKDKHRLMVLAQIATILLGIAFLCMQCHEYIIAYTEKGLTLGSGIYGSTFFILTGFHCAHVTIGTIMLCVILWRMFKNDITSKNHFSFEAVSWYWHFVDVVWLGLFIFVYWI
ncbi:MAG TPA: cytochrome c oxidase subunit 3 [Coxiellaceae bacterium]|nr:cytochrome c oxidase subunit 3 [Coxiellaceae bacterium]